MQLFRLKLFVIMVPGWNPHQFDCNCCDGQEESEQNISSLNDKPLVLGPQLSGIKTYDEIKI
jgi:hypothetical protein